MFIQFFNSNQINRQKKEPYEHQNMVINSSLPMIYGQSDLLAFIKILFLYLKKDQQEMMIQDATRVLKDCVTARKVLGSTTTPLVPCLKYVMGYHIVGVNYIGHVPKNTFCGIQTTPSLTKNASSKSESQIMDDIFPIWHMCLHVCNFKFVRICIDMTF